MKLKLLFILAFLYCSSLYALDVIPKYAGNLSTDTIKIPIIVNDIDTVQIYEAMNLAGGDKIIIHRYGPDNTLITADTNTASIVKLQNGIYEARYRASDGSGTLGAYRVIVQVYFKGKIRGGEALAYYVMPKGLSNYLVDIEDQGFHAGAVLKSTEVWYTRTLNGQALTDSIVTFDSLGVRQGVRYYTRPGGSSVITGSGNTK